MPTCTIFALIMPAMHISSRPTDQWHMGSRRIASPAMAEQASEGERKGFGRSGEWGWNGEDGGLSEVPTSRSLLEPQSPA